MESLLNVEVAVQLGDEREAALRSARTPIARPRTAPVRRWIGRELVLVGTRLAGEEATWIAKTARHVHTSRVIGDKAVIRRPAS